ncbi:sugar transporter [Hyphomicrobium methylovorum]|uniref:polysaccharide biosynthesis/export family protein n=1 Tax=Hyphomicrobium methylovorum TaxID=84 RepID=UPI0015E7BF7A|nr:polysaccharide biosynthesis/export family protein [Hyphomicrobium methylovorum]MBA2127637.1 sugar transporter [Hyphomicrobium methylovorum]
MPSRVVFVLALAAPLLTGGCASLGVYTSDEFVAERAAGPNADGYPVPVTLASADAVAWGPPLVMPAPVVHAEIVADNDGPYLLDTGDRLRVFIYGQPNLSRLYTVDHEGKIAVPLIGSVRARGLTTNALQSAIRSRLGQEYVKDPQVTIDIQQNRPFFILGEVKNAGQFPYVSGMTVETAVAIGGGYTERASERSFRISRNVGGVLQQIEVPGAAAVRPGDTVYVFERFF